MTYVLFMVAMARYTRRLRAGTALPPRKRDDGRPDLRALARGLLLTAAAGYGVFVVILLVFYVGLGASTWSFAVKGLLRGAALAAVAVAVLLGAAALRWGRGTRQAEPTQR